VDVNVNGECVQAGGFLGRLDIWIFIYPVLVCVCYVCVE
jgi:hypothetical protein